MAAHPARRSRAWVAALLALMLAIAGCGGDDDGDETAQDAAPTTQETDTAERPPAEDEPDGGGQEGNASAGESVFAENCASCHGTTGGGGSAPSLQRAELAEDRDRVADQIINGGGGMPPFGDQLSDQQIADVTAYVVEELAQR